MRNEKEAPKTDVSVNLPQGWRNEPLEGKRNPLLYADTYKSFRDWMISVEERLDKLEGK